MPDLPAAAVVLRCLLALCCVVLPGAAVLQWNPMRGRHAAERLIVAFGLGIAVVALTALLGRILGLSFSPAAVVLLLLGFGLLWLAGFLRNRKNIRWTIPGLLPLALLAGILALRFVQIRDLVFPPWVDSVHHAFLIRVFLERGGLPADLSPWLPIPFYYHYAFHSAAALFAAFSGLPPDSVLLIFGQILNAMAALSAYRLALSLKRDARFGLLAMALVGFLTQMPAFYLSWGRYTLLTGMVLLPLAAAEAVEYTCRAPRRAGLVRLALLTAGVLLAHYLAGLLLALFLLLVGTPLLWRATGRSRFAGLSAAALAGTALALPWLLPMLRQAAPEIDLRLVSPADPLDSIYFADYGQYLWKLLGPLRNYLVCAAGFVAAGAALFRRGPLRLFAVWGLLLGLLALPWGVHLAPFRPDHLVIVLFLPAAVLAAGLYLDLMDSLHNRLPQLRPQLWLAVLAVALCALGIWDTRSIVRQATVFADAADREAVAWAGRNTPADSLFLINVTPWQNGLYRGVDGGWWLLPLADRRTLLPPMIYSFAARAYVEGVVRTAEETRRLEGCTPEFWTLAEEQGITHLYVRENAGSLRPSAVEKCLGFERVFQFGEVSIFKITIPR